MSSWNSGYYTFIDPLPTQTFLYSMDVQLYGRFNCENDTRGAPFICTLGNVFIDFGYFNSTYQGCACPNCVGLVTLSSPPQPLGWSGYNYNANNTLILFVTDNRVCLSQVVLTLTGMRESEVDNIVPTSSPEYVPTKIYLNGKFNFNNTRYQCNFTSSSFNYSQPAYYINSSALYCNTYSNLTANFFSLTVLEANDDNSFNKLSGPFLFVVYKQPTINSVLPSNGTKEGGNRIYLSGTGFFQTPGFIIKVKFGDQLVGRVDLDNSSLISCIAPPYISGNPDVKIVISENGFDFTASGPLYHYNGINDNDDNDNGTLKNIFKIGLITGGAFVALVIIGIIIFFSLNNRKVKKKKKVFEENAPLLSHIESSILEGIEVEKVNQEEIEIKKRIGRGSFGEVYKAEWRGITIAVKKLPKHLLNAKFLNDFIDEISMTNKLRHPNVLKVLGVCIDGNNINMLTEYIHRGSLYKVLHDSNTILDWPKMQTILLDAAKGMNYLHKRKVPIIHRDLKSHNLLVDENFRVRICDFGLSRFLENQEKTMTACGTPCWTAPEVLRNERYTESADVYSFGIVLWECITREDPFDGMPPFQVVYAVGNQGKRPDIPKKCPYPLALIDLMKRCWDESPEKRPSFAEIVSTLSEIHEVKSSSNLSELIINDDDKLF